MLESGQYGEVPTVKTFVSYNAESGVVKMFAHNLTQEEANISVRIPAFRELHLVKKAVYRGNLTDKNVCGSESCAIVQTKENDRFDGGCGTVCAQPYSLTMFVFSVKA